MASVSGVKREVAIGALIALVVLAFGVVAAVSLVSADQTVKTQGLGPSSKTVTSSLSLNLTASVNSTVVVQGEGLKATVSEVNTLLTQNNVTAGKDWPMQGLTDGPCGTMNYPFGLAVLQGFYTAQNASDGHPLGIFAPGPYMCPMILTYQGPYLFEPVSDRAFVGPSQWGPISMNSSLDLTGTWDQSTFAEFPLGVYTLVGGDEWGSVVTVHFAVVSEGQAASLAFGAPVKLTGDMLPLLAHATMLGPANPSQTLTVTFYLKDSSNETARSVILAWEAASGLSPGVRQCGSSESILPNGTARTSSGPCTVQSMETTMTVGQAERLFSMKIDQYIYGGQVFFANSDDVTVPSEVAEAIFGVGGLNDFNGLVRLAS